MPNEPMSDDDLIIKIARLMRSGDGNKARSIMRDHDSKLSASTLQAAADRVCTICFWKPAYCEQCLTKPAILAPLNKDPIE